MKPNAALQARGAVAATQERRLFPVACKRWLDRGRLEPVVVLWLNMGHRLQDLLEIGPLPLLGFAG
jgi:hypothetical protein